MVTQAQSIQYYKDKKLADTVVRGNVQRRGHTVFGARALNAHFPAYLDTPTEDWDVFSKTPKKTAHRVEGKLDRAYGGNFFRVKKAKHPGTYKVINRVTKKGIADYSKPQGLVPAKTLGGVKYVKLAWVKSKIRRTLRDPSAKFRHDKDRESLQRIKLHERRGRQRRPMMRRSHSPFDVFFRFM